MKLTTFTTRADTIFGVSFIVVAPEHPKVKTLTKDKQKLTVKEYLEKVATKSERERQISKVKTGVFTGSYVKHPLLDKKIPIWIADYVLYNYGSGIIMAVPAHDERDFEFAKKYNLEILPVIKPKKGNSDNLQKPYTQEGLMVNSKNFNDLSSKKAKKEIANLLITKNLARKKINYKFRDWVFSRQRYWGEPFALEYFQENIN